MSRDVRYLKIKSTYALDIRSERRKGGDPINDFTFPLAQAGIRTPKRAEVHLQVVGGLMPIQNGDVGALRKRVRVYMENLPVRYDHNTSAVGGDSRTAVAHADFRDRDSIYARFTADNQPVVQLVTNSLLGDLRITLVDENGDPFVPGADWTLFLQISADQARYANLYE